MGRLVLGFANLFSQIERWNYLRTAHCSPSGGMGRSHPAHIQPPKPLVPVVHLFARHHYRRFMALVDYTGSRRFSPHCINPTRTKKGIADSPSLARTQPRLADRITLLRRSFEQRPKDCQKGVGSLARRSVILRQRCLHFGLCRNGIISALEGYGGRPMRRSRSAKCGSERRGSNRGSDLI